MSKITFEPNASGTGVFTIASPNSDTDYTMNLPEINGGTLVSTDASGNVGIGTASPAYNLAVNETATSGTDHEITRWSTTSGGIFGLLVDDLSSGNPLWTFRAATNEELAFKIGASEAMRIDASGNLLVGTTSTTIDTSNFGFLVSDGRVETARNASGGGAVVQFYGNVGEFRVLGDGDAQNTNNSYGAISDERFKSNIVDANPQLDDIMAVQVRSYTLDSTGATHIGVVAQELEAAGMSGLVKEDEDGIKSVKYSVLYMKAIKAIQEQQAMIEELKVKVAALEAN